MSEKKKYKLFYIIAITFYFFSFVYSIANLYKEITLTHSQAILSAIECIVAVVCLFLPRLVEKLFQVKVSFHVSLFLAIYVFCAVFLGEVCEFYYKISFWDSFLHVLMAFFLAFLGYMIGNQFFNEPNKRKSMIVIAYTSFCFCMAVGATWELIEFTIDSLFGTNMQKFIPEVKELWNTGDAFKILKGTNAEIATFFREPKGYKYALMDTMEDLICDFVGGALGMIVCCAIYKDNQEFFYHLMNSKNHPYEFKDDIKVISK